MKRYLGVKKLLRIYIDTLDKVDGKPLWEHILLETKNNHLAGATVYKAQAGMGAFSEIHSFKLLTLSQELPLVIEIIDDEEKIYKFIEHLDPLLENALITLMDVEVIRYKHQNFGKGNEV